MMRMALFLIISLMNGLFVICADAASFYGASYVSFAFQEAKSTTDIHLRFKTHQSDALLLLAAGRTDYCMMVLESGGLKVRINLGAGEAELTSPPGLRLNDLLWHEASLQRTDADMLLVVDTIHRTRLTIPGRFYELNIHYGVYVGGLGDFNELFLGNVENFRGCVDNLTLNSVNVFRQSREISDQRRVHAVTWDCSPEFDATSDRAFSFVGTGAFLALPTMNARNGGSFSLDLKTQGNTSVLLYNGGLPSRSDFVALEMMGGKAKLSVDKGNGVVELKSDVAINDGQWHHIEVRFSPTYVEINVDDHVTNLRPGLGENRHFDLVGKLYLGGIELNKQTRALAHGLDSMLKSDTHDGSFKGCMHNFHVNGQLLGLRETEVSHQVQVDCVWEYPCLRNPCVQEATCLQQGMDGFRCLCDKAVCVKSGINIGYKLYSKSSSPGEMEILELQPVQVKEGGSELVTSNNIQVVLDYHKFGIRESAILFHVVHLPEHGRLEVEIWRRSGESIFTFLDLNSDKVRYVHDGSENHQDTLVLEVEFIARRDQVPEYLAQRHRFVLSIIITPVNDPPELKLPPGRVLRLAQNTKKILTSEILSATDQDNQPEDLVYTVLMTAGSVENGGFVENGRNPGVPVETFTQSDVNAGLITYVHRGRADTKIAFRVSDGVETGQTGVLRIAAFDLELYMVNNSGLLVTYNSFAYILPDNLTFATNAVEQNLEIRYDVTRPPLFGSVQRLRNNEHWQSVSHFTQRQMVVDKIRYVHVTGRPSHDEFKFTATCNGVTSSVYDFRVTFQAITLHVVNNNELVLDQIQEKVMTLDNLKVETTPVATPDEDILYNLVTVPVYGALYLMRRDHKREKLQVSGNFSQSDVALGSVRYRLSRKSYSTVFDNYLFRVITPNEASEVLQFGVRHLPGETDAVIVIERVEVDEGERRAITTNQLHVETPIIKDFLFNVTRLPHYGQLQVVTSGDGNLEEEQYKSVTWFTSDDLRNGRVSYVHDDSEHDRDSFVFLVTPQSDVHDFQYIGTQHVHVRMKNDNPPDRAVDKVFQVVIDGERLLTGDDLRFVDPDIDTPSYVLQYTRRGIPNGVLFHLSNMDAQVFQFTQKDLDDGNILFRHSGPAYGRTVFWVTDGQFYTSGVLEIRASEPFVSVVNNTGIVVKRGKRSKISQNNLSVETNVNIQGKDVTYTVTSAPEHGKILVNGRESDQFSQWQMGEEMVEYENDNGDNFQDSFSVVVHVGDVKAEARIGVKVFPESYWEPLMVVSNRTITVDEGQVVVIDQSSLQVTHPNVDPRDITFVVHSQPLFGSLEVDNNNNFPTSNGEGPSVQFPGGALTIFDQATINEGKLKYVQVQHNVSEDFFVFDVTNGVVQIPGLVFRLHVISKVILLQTHNLTVEEGGKVTLTLENLHVLSRYSPQQVVEFSVTSSPSNGFLEMVKNSGTTIVHFTQKMLQDGVVRYVHDGSESARDNFTVVAKIKETDRESLPTRVYLLVEPVNDEFPKVVNNSELQVWMGAVTVIGTSHLAAVDEDSGPEDLHFLLSSVKNGHVALINDRETAINNFTQVDLNRGTVVFVHSGSVGGSSIGFYFQVSDGKNEASMAAFKINAKSIWIELVINEKLYVFPKVRQTISSENLLAVTSDKDPSRELRYKVITKPQFGKLLLEDQDGVAKETTNFTQNDVNSSRLVYEHVKPFTDLTAFDLFDFDVHCDFAPPLVNRQFGVEISLLKINPEGLDHYVALQPPKVEEGGRVVVNQSHLNTSSLAKVLNESSSHHLDFVANVHLVIHKNPLHGLIQIHGENVTVGASFTQKDVDEGGLTYVHDHSDTLKDTLGFGIYLDSSAFGGTDANLLNGSLDFTILPVNDQNFELITKNPRIEVVQKHRVLISSDHLKTIDPDTSAKDIRYDIVTPPSTGRLILVNLSADENVNFFSQLDVDEGRLIYVHDGNGKDDDSVVTFYFKVSDGAFRPVYRVFNIYVLELSLSMVNHTDVDVSQATTAVYLKSSNLGAQTNGNRSMIFYNVTSHPKHGMLLLHDESVSQFSQKDVDDELVIYVMRDLGVGEDEFAASVWIEDKVLKNQTFKMVVSPLIRQREYHMPLESKVVLTLAFLNATQLAQQTKSVPVFTLTRNPKFGILRLLKRRGRPKRDGEEVNSGAISHFTHGDVVKKRVYYEFIEKNALLTNDSFEYRLSALGVPPAKGRFDFIFHPPGTFLPDLVFVDDVIREDKVTEERGGGKRRIGGGSTTAGIPIIEGTRSPEPEVVEPGVLLNPPRLMSNDHLIIIGVAVGVVLLGVLVIVVVKCHVQCFYLCRRSKKSSSTTKNGIPSSAHHLHHHDEQHQRPDILEQGGDYPPMMLNEQVPSISSRSSGPISPKFRPCLTTRDTPSPAGRQEEWLEVSSTVPSCKVTPLGLHTGLETNETTLKYPYGMLEPQDVDEWNMYDHAELRFQRPNNPVLKKNQYWV